MKNLLLLCLVMALSYGVQAQVVPLKVYNGTTSILIVHSVVVDGLSPACAGGTSAYVGMTVMPGAMITIAPLITGPAAANFDWSVAKITNLTYTASLGAVHPYFYGCFGTGGSSGMPVLTDYWYPIGSTPYQLLKVY